MTKWTQTIEMKQNQTFFHGIWHHIFFYHKILRHFNDFPNQNFSVLWLKWTQAMEMKWNQTFSMRHIQIWHHIFFYQKILKYFNDFPNRNFSVLLLNWTQTIEMKQHQTSFHGTCSNLTPYFFIKKC